jgi:hypothetical protein
MAEPKYNSGGVEAERTEMTRDEDAGVSVMRETADDGLPFTVDEQADLTKAVRKSCIIGRSQQKLENSVNRLWRLISLGTFYEAAEAIKTMNWIIMTE